MLISFNTIYHKLKLLNIDIKGILHIGAHDCEELEAYLNENIDPTNIVWIDAIKEKVDQAVIRGIPNVFNAVIHDKEENITFKITNNGQSSSILDLDIHLKYYPGIQVVENRVLKTTTLYNFFNTYSLNTNTYNFWNLDIQGTELYALKSAGNIIDNVDAIYLEVNMEHLYKDCPLITEIDIFLNEKGFDRSMVESSGAGWGDALYIRKCYLKIS
jgi:hypothetical protein